MISAQKTFKLTLGLFATTLIILSALPESNEWYKAQSIPFSIIQNQFQASLNSQLKDGVYTETVTGFKPGLVVQVNIENAKITTIKVLENNETPVFLNKVLKILPQSIIKAQSTNVSTVSGATYTSKGIIQAVDNVLKKASQLTPTVSLQDINSLS